MIAKTDGTTFNDHIKKVVTNIEKVVGNIPQNKIDILKVIANLHDIGKLTESFQSYLNGKIEVNKYLHNEIGWAFLSKHLNHKDKDIIIDSVLYHHGINCEHNTTDTIIYNSLTDKDILNMSDYLNELDLYKDKEVNDNILPLCFGEKIPEKLLYRSLLIIADRIDDVKINKPDIILNKTNYDNTERFERQKDILKHDEKTIIYNTPAGFGKTVVGLLWGIKTNEKIIWVCPENMIARSVYDNILKELKNLNIDLSVELFLTDKVEKSTNKSKGFGSDIIVTNIDNFLFTAIKNNKLHKLYTITKANVIFDEYHIFLNKSAYFSLFINIMKVRTMNSDVRTLLLSATPINIGHLFSTKKNKVTYLPDIYKHYKASHDKPYKFSFDKKIHDKNNLIIYNTIKSTQDYKDNYNCEHIFHSKFETHTRKEHYELLIKKYGKPHDEKNILATHVIQTSIDISFKNLTENCLSPQTTLQRIGRCNRWGEYDDSEICIINDEHDNKKIVSVLYDDNLHKKWYDYLRKKISNIKCLDELYTIYNDFEKDNEKVIKNYIDKLYETSLDKLKLIYVKKYTSKTTDNSNSNVNSNLLRSDGDDIYVIYRKDDDTLTEPFTVDKKTITIPNNIKKYIKKYNSLIKDDSRYDQINKRTKNLNMDNFTYYNRPYYDNTKKYNQTFGVY